MVSDENKTEFIYTSEKVEPLTEEQLIEFKNSTNDTNTHSMYDKVGSNKTNENKVALKVYVEHTSPSPLTDEKISLYRKKLDEFDRMEKERVKTIEARNGLETLIYARKEWLSDELKTIVFK